MSMFRATLQILSADGERSLDLSMWVDSGALYTQMPASVLTGLGYEPDDTRLFRLADGTTFESPIGDIRVSLNGRRPRNVVCVFAEEDSDLLIGATTLEAFTVGVDPVNERLIPDVARMLTMIPVDE